MLLPDPETCRRLARDVAPRWIWFAGMLANSDGEAARVVYTGPGVIAFHRYMLSTGRYLPVLTDPLTAAGALLVFQAVYAEPEAHVTFELGQWFAWANIDGSGNGREGVGRGPTQLEATIAAILAAPET